MSRIRSIKPEFFTSETIARLDVFDRLLFVGLWTHADDAGRCVDNAKLIRAALFPLDDLVTFERIHEGLRSLHAEGLIHRYVVDERHYLVISGWSEHQKISHPTESKLPAPDQGQEELVNPPELFRSPPETLRPERKGKEQGKEQGKDLAPLAATPEKSRARDELFDALVETCGIDYETLTKGGRGPINRALAELRAVNATPNEIQRRAANYRQHFTNAPLTPSALAKQWAQCAQPPRRQGNSVFDRSPALQNLLANRPPAIETAGREA